MKLYSYWRSSAAYRVRIALQLKELAYETIPVHLLRDGGEQYSAAYQQANPQQLVPALETEQGIVLSQSLAIIDYLEECYPAPALLPQDPLERARVRSLALSIACDIHPLNNLRVIKYLGDTLARSATQRNAWYRHWIQVGFTSFEAQLAQQAHSAYCHGGAPGLADIFLVPQVYNARRFDVDLKPFPNIVRIDETCRQLPAFHAAAPEQQPDAQKQTVE